MTLHQSSHQKLQFTFLAALLFYPPPISLLNQNNSVFVGNQEKTQELFPKKRNVFYGDLNVYWCAGEALSAESLCAAWTKLFHGELALLFGLKQALGKRNLQGKGGVWGAVEQELGSQGMEEGPLQRLGGAGK